MPLPADGQAMRNYTEAYTYDPVGNITSVVHTAANGNWTRTYAYDEPANPPASNQLTSTTVGSTTSSYTYDPDGNMTTMPQLRLMTWDWKNQLQATALHGSRQTARVPDDLLPVRLRRPAGPQGHRQPGRARSPASGSTSAATRSTGSTRPPGRVTLERQSLHVPDGARLICLVETTTIDASAAAGAAPSSRDPLPVRQPARVRRPRTRPDGRHPHLRGVLPLRQHVLPDRAAQPPR